MPPSTHRAAVLLAENVTRLMASDEYRAALAFRRRFSHTYSFRNLWLIYLQCPTASMVAGFRAWQSVGRQVRKGERSLAIYAPLTRKDKATGELSVHGFRSASVFDISQTEGEPVPEPPRPELLSAPQALPDTVCCAATVAHGPLLEVYRSRLEAFARSHGVAVSYAPLVHGNGVYSPTGRRITVVDTLPPLQTLKTLVHEVAHALLHDEQDAYHLGELEAESCAFLVCDALSLDTSRYSFPYLASWAEKPEELLGAAERACKVADTLLEALVLLELEQAA